MTVALPLYFVACLCLGSGALALLAACALRTGSRELRSFLLFFAVLEALVASNLVLFSLGAGGAPGISPAMFAVMLLDKCLSGVLLMTAVLVAHAALDVPWRRIGSALAGAAALAAAFFSAQPTAFSYDPAARAVVQHLPLDPLAPVGLVLILYTTLLLLLFRNRIAGAYERRLVTGLLIVTAVFVPGFASDLFLLPAARPIAALPLSLIFFPSYLAVLSILVAVESTRFLARRTHGASPSLGRERVMEQLAERHELTAREVEIAGLLATGLGNKQIAWQLGISDRTVGNHIYSLYRKIGINSRFELMGLLNSQAA